MTTLDQPRESLDAILQVERREEDLFGAELEDFQGEPLGGDALARAALAARWSLNEWPERNFYFGGVHAVRPDAASGGEGAADTRRGGHAISI